MTDVARFLDGLRRREEAYRRMARAAEETAAGDIDALLALAARKGALLEEIEVIEKDLAPDRARWPELRAGLDPGTLREVEETVDRTRRLLEELVRREDEGKAPPERSLPGFVDRRRALGAYGAR
jgi:hypothetical protein